MEKTIGKKLLVLGGGIASYDLVKTAKAMGVYTIVTDNSAVPGVAKAIADEQAMISTTDIDGLAVLCKEKQVDGVYAGPSEFNLRNVIGVCKKAGLRCYTNPQIWSNCANKDYFKKFCREYGVDCTPEYSVHENSTAEELKALDYPIIVKPVDGSSSSGVSVCQDWSAVAQACRNARSKSLRGEIIVEKYIENCGEVFSVRYLMKNGEAIAYCTTDDYVAEAVNRTALFGGFHSMPSKYSSYYMENMDEKVQKMLKGMGIRDGNVFIQALPYKGKIYFHEMAHRLSGGMMFKLAEPLMGINVMKMMIRYAVGGELYTQEDLKGICFVNNPKHGFQVVIPLNVGKIHRIEGLEKCLQEPTLVDFLQYYNEGDTVSEQVKGTLGQVFGRFSLVSNSEEELQECYKRIRDCLKVYDTEGKLMNTIQFDLKRLEHREIAE